MIFIKDINDSVKLAEIQRVSPPWNNNVDYFDIHDNVYSLRHWQHLDHGGYITWNLFREIIDTVGDIPCYAGGNWYVIFTCLFRDYKDFKGTEYQRDVEDFIAEISPYYYKFNLNKRIMIKDLYNQRDRRIRVKDALTPDNYKYIDSILNK